MTYNEALYLWLEKMMLTGFPLEPDDKFWINFTRNVRKKLRDKSEETVAKIDGKYVPAHEMVKHQIWEALVICQREMMKEKKARKK